MASNGFPDLKAEVTCCICLDFFRDPVSVDCGHNFCRACVEVCEQGPGGCLPCPRCRRASYKRDLRPNWELGNIVKLVKRRCVSEEARCEQHGQPLQLFCEEDRALVCAGCVRCREHRSHCVRPVAEAARVYKEILEGWLGPLSEEMEGLLEAKRNGEQYKAQMKKLEVSKLDIVSEIEGLRFLLKNKEQKLQSIMADIDRVLTQVESTNMGKLSNQAASLSTLILELEKKCKEPAWELLRDIKGTLKRCREVVFQNLKLEVKCYKVVVTFDARTANRILVLSEGRKRVRHNTQELPIPNTPKRFSNYPCVLGAKGFTSGRYYWEVEVLQDGTGWLVGVMGESVSREQGFTWPPEKGVWVVGKNARDYVAHTYPEITALSLRDHPRKVGVYLDYMHGRLSVFNPGTMEHIYTFFNASFTGTIFPFVLTCKDSDLRLV
ncbi:E3 ubiquitin-protein ligase TRIM39-like [Lissotriton helveticus]